jgi:3'(2'), 5'-bisphosphate nucleotidase
MTVRDQDHELEEILAIARRASRLVLDVYATPFEVELKGPNDPVTRADREANELICGALAERFPDAAVIGEESAPSDPAELSRLVQRDRTFFVDPVDGTREFADRNGEFAVMIGMCDAGRPEIGVVIAPVTGDALVGRVGASGPRAAFREDAEGKRTPLTPTTLDDPKRARLMVSRSHRPRIVEPLTRALGITTQIPCGSVGLKVARIATGDADLYVHGGRGAKRWDSCGPEAILVAAGGRFTDATGTPIDYRSADLALRRGLLASNEPLFAVVRDAIAALDPAVRT